MSPSVGARVGRFLGTFKGQFATIWGYHSPIDAKDAIPIRADFPLVDRQALVFATAGIDVAITHADPIRARLTAFSPQAK
jgi:hypothetical protein